MSVLCEWFVYRLVNCYTDMCTSFLALLMFKMNSQEMALVSLSQMYLSNAEVEDAKKIISRATLPIKHKLIVSLLTTRWTIQKTETTARQQTTWSRQEVHCLPKIGRQVLTVIFSLVLSSTTGLLQQAHGQLGRDNGPPGR